MISLLVFNTKNLNFSPPTTFKGSKHLKTPSTPLSPLVLPSFWTTAPVALSSPGLPIYPSTPVFSNPLSSPVLPNPGSSPRLPNDSLIMKPPPPPYPFPASRPVYQHSSHLSCPVETESPKKQTHNASNFSFDSG